MPGGASEGQGAAEDAAAVVLQRGGGFLQILVDLGGCQVKRTFREPALDLLDPCQRFAPQFTESRHKLPPHERQGAADEAEEAQHRDGDGGAVRDPPVLSQRAMGLSKPANRAATITGMIRKLI